MACGFGALVLILLISEFQESEIKITKNDANQFLDATELKNIKVKKLSLLEEDIQNELLNLSDAIKQKRLLESILKQRQIVAKNLNNLASRKEYSINKKKQLQNINFV